MIRIKADISKFQRELGAITKGPNSIYQDGGRQFRQMLYDEFTTLVRETPQYSGSTAASWQIGFIDDLDGTGYVELPKPKEGIEAHQKGASPAVDIAISKAFHTLFGSDPSQYMRRNIILLNNAPGFDTAEEGPVRPVNTPPGALDRFMARLATTTAIEDYY